jgi:hypothetical protein
MATKHEDPLDLSHESIRTAIYKDRILLPTNGNQSPTLSGLVPTEVQFEIPAGQCMNLSQSLLNFRLVFPSTAAATFGKIWKYGLTFIDRVDLRTASGSTLVSIPYVGNYTRMVWMAQTPLDQFLQYPQAGVGSGAVAANTYQEPQPGFFFAKNAAPLGAAAGALVANSTGVGYTTHAAGMGVSQDPITGVEWLATGAVGGAGADAGFIFINASIPLGMLRNTLFERNINLMFSEPLHFVVNFAPSFRMGFQSDAANDTTTPANQLTPTLSRLEMVLKMDTVAANQAALRNQIVSGGLSLQIPFTTVWRYVRTGAADKALNQRITPAQGQLLHAVYHQAVLSAEISRTDYNAVNQLATNVSCNKYDSYITSLDGVDQQPKPLLCYQHKDYENMREKLKGSVYQSLDSYRINPVHVDLWSAARLVDLDASKSGGIALDHEMIWSIILNHAAANVNTAHYIAAVCSKTLRITADGVMVV